MHNPMSDATPRTASDMQAAFEARQGSRAGGVESERLKAFIAKAKNFNFFGLFEGETGEMALGFYDQVLPFPWPF